MEKVQLLEQMVKESPNSSSAWYLLGLEYLEQHKLSEALGAFSEALKFSDDEMKLKVINELTRLNQLMQTKPIDNNLVDDSQREQIKVDDDIDDHDVEDYDEDDHDVEDYDVDNYDEDDYEENYQEDVDGHFQNSNNNVIAFNQREKVKNLRIIKGGSNGKGTDLLETSKEVVTFAEVGGLEDLKETIRMKIIKPFTNPGLFARFRKKTGGGILLYGPPGCGKTFIARATAGECQAKFINVHITDIIDPYQGVSEQNIKEVFRDARAKKPSILFFDEIDAIGYHRAKASSEYLRGVVDQLLTEMEGIDTSTDKLLIVGATNMPWDVDPAFKRPGRFDKVIFVPPPDELGRENIFKLKLKEKPLGNIDYSLLAKKTELYSGADIENVVELATEKVITEIMNTETERPIQMQDLLAAIEETNPSTLEWLRTIRNYIKYANQGGLYNDVDKYISKYKKLF